jgi:hypothetical protein
VLRTRARRPDMYEKLTFGTSKQEKKFLAEVEAEWEELQHDRTGDPETMGTGE